MGAIALSLALLVPHAAEPTPVQAACGTNWTSRVIPPPTIKVLRTTSGRVETVDFRRYVAMVMASGEWPSFYPPAELEAGAVATKQYAWYHALEDHHRSWYRTPSGVCYDVRDDTNDQIYRPETSEPTRKQLDAIDRTWALSLRKHGRFFMTGYRRGTATRCAADANGWKLYARSVRDCAARLDWSRERIQQAYYAPGIEEVWATSLVKPEAHGPRLQLEGASTYPGQAAVVRWAEATSPARIVRYRLQRRVDDSAWRDVTLPDPLARRVVVSLPAGKTHRFRVRAIDAKDRVSRWERGPRLRAVLREPARMELIGSDWELARTAGTTDDSTAVTGTAGHRVRLRFTGRSVGYVASMGPGMGHARILVNGRVVAVVDLAAETELLRQLVWTRDWKRSTERTVVVEVLDADAPVDVDAFVIVR